MFMGSEFGQFIEWNYEQELDWLLLDYPQHQKMQNFFKAINHFYLENPALWQIDFSWEGFSWISNDDFNQSVIVFRRIDKNGHEIITVCNFLPLLRENYQFGVPFEGLYAEVFSSDKEEFGGNGITNGNSIQSQPKAMHGYEHSISVTLPPMSVLYLECRHKKLPPVKKIQKINQ